MARAIWSGSISFGLLNVPVKLYSAVSKKSVSFRELRESDGSRIRHKRVAEADGEEVDYGDIVEIDPIYFDHPYYLGPDKGAERAYGLLVKAMADSNKVAVARFVLRSKE